MQQCSYWCYEQHGCCSHSFMIYCLKSNRFKSNWYRSHWLKVTGLRCIVGKATDLRATGTGAIVLRATGLKFIG